MDDALEQELTKRLEGLDDSQRSDVLFDFAQRCFPGWKVALCLWQEQSQQVEVHSISAPIEIANVWLSMMVQWGLIKLGPNGTATIEKRTMN
jgi:hypothetical protein